MASGRRVRWSLALAATGLSIGAGVAVAADGEVRAAAAPVTVTIKSFQFMPAELTVPSGTTVTWNNTDKILHTATSGKPGAPDGRFHGEMPDAGTSYGTTLTGAGVYEYFCSRHEQMLGKVVVQ